MDSVMAEFIKKGPDRKLLKAEKTKSLAGFIRGVQRIGGFGGKSDLLATCQTYTGNPGCYIDSAKYSSKGIPHKQIEHKIFKEFTMNKRTFKKYQQKNNIKVYDLN